MSDRSDPDDADQTNISPAALPALDCAPLAPPSPLHSTPFAYNSSSERFEYLFFLTQPPPSPESHRSASSSSSTQGFASGSIVSPSAAALPGQSAAQPYPPASTSIAASQSLMFNQRYDDGDNDAHVMDAPAPAHTHHRTASQQCVIADTNPPMPPSLLLKRRSMQVGSPTTSIADTGSGMGLDAL